MIGSTLRLLAAGCVFLCLLVGAQTLRLDRAEARLLAAQTELKICVEGLKAARAARETEEKAFEAYDQNRGLAEPDAARRRLREGSFLLGPAAGP